MSCYERIAVLRLDALGDTLLSTPALRALQDSFPKAQLRVYTQPAGSAVLRDWVEIEEVGPDVDLSARVKQFRPDCVLAFSEKRRSIRAAHASGAARRAGFDPGLTQPLKSLWLRLALTDRLPYPNDLRRDPGMHEVERYLALTGLVGARPYAGPLHLPLPETARQRALEVVGEGRPWGLQLTPKWGLGGWSVEWLQSLAAQLPRPLLGFYGPAEKEWAEKYFPELSLCYQPDLLQYAAMVARCRALLTVDTGAAHVAAAVGTPVVDVFPEENQAHCVRRWRPWKVEHCLVLKPAWAPSQEVPLRDRLVQACADLDERTDLRGQAHADWSALLRAGREGDERAQAFQPILEAVEGDAEARGMFPHLSMWTLRTSRCPDYPFDPGPEVEWVDGQFRLDDAPPTPADVVLKKLLPILRRESFSVYSGGSRL